MQLPEQPNLYIYSRFKDRLKPEPKNIPFYFLGSGSSGNSVYLKPLYTVIDLGFPYSHYRDLNTNFFLHVDYLFLTHQHSDHLNPATLMKILDMYPNVKVVLTSYLYQYIISDEYKHLKDNQKVLLTHQYASRLQIIDEPTELETRTHKKFMYIPHHTEHGPIQNVAIELQSPDLNIQFMYASDLDTLGPGTHSQAEGLPTEPTKKFNLLLLEANYDADKINDMITTATKKMQDAQANGDMDSAKYFYNQTFRAKENLRHISEQATWGYVQKHLDNNGWFVPLHASTTFGTLIQKLE